MTPSENTHGSSAVRDLDALESAPPQELFRTRLELRRRPSVALLNVLTVVLLTVSFAPFDCWYLAYVALVPWMLAVMGGVHGRWSVLWAWLAGGLFWAGNLYWLTWITVVGYLALVFYLSLYWLVTAVVIRLAVRRNQPMWLVLPTVWVALEYARSYVITGFPWLFLAQSQYARTPLIQVADITGQYGVSFFVAMVNGTIVDLLCAPLFTLRRGKVRLTRRIPLAVTATILTCVGLLTYGTWRLQQDTRREGPVIGIVQQAYPVSLYHRGASAKEILSAYLAASENLLGSGCDLVIWPESVLPPPGLNRELLEVDLESLDLADLRELAAKFVGREYINQYSSPVLRRELAGWIGQRGRERNDEPSLRSYAERVAALSRKLGCPILSGGPSLHYNRDDPADRWLRRNSAMWFEGDWRNKALYSKMHLVLFSEEVPFKRSWPWLYRLLRSLVPESMPQLDPGKEVRRFELIRGRRRYLLGSPICYEGTLARICRRIVAEKGRKVLDILVNLSNDGWFVWQSSDGARRRGSTEHAQHLVQYCFRAVENRVPVVRAVNTGISASIDSNGRIVSQIRRDGKRSMLVGTLLLDGRTSTKEGCFHGPKVLVDTRVSLYSLIGDVFAIIVSLAALGIVGRLVFSRPHGHGEVK